jgi:hypothetical protein
MSQIAPARTGYADMVNALATELREALDGRSEDWSLTGFAAAAGDRDAALAAIRILGADALAVHSVAALHPTRAEADLISEAIDRFPRHAEPRHQLHLAWQDWAFLEAAGFAEPPTPAVPGFADAAGWSRWLAPLSSVALPGLHSPLHEAAAEPDRLAALTRGAAEAAERRDYATAAALGRWLAMLDAPGADRTVDQAARYRATDPRTALDAAIARRFLPPDF